MNLRNLVLKRDRHQCDLIIDVIRDLSNKDLRNGILAEAAPDLDGFNSYNPNLAQIGIFHRDVLQQIVLSEFKNRGGPTGLAMSLLEQVLLRLRHEMLVQTGYGQDSFHLNPALYLLGKGIALKSLVYGIEYVAEHMIAAVPVINVRNGNGDIECGSGVIFHSRTDGHGVLLTNKHVLENRDILEIKVASREVVPVGVTTYCKDADLAKLVIKLPTNVPVVEVAEESQILDPIISMGYPRVPTSTEQTVLSHRGEINGRIKTFAGEEFFAISCLVSPGNSGGPIFTKMGYCAGIVTRSTFSAESSKGDANKGSTVYHLAIPEEKIREFLSQ